MYFILQDYNPDPDDSWSPHTLCITKDFEFIKNKALEWKTMHKKDQNFLVFEAWEKDKRISNLVFRNEKAVYRNKDENCKNIANILEEE